MALSSGMAPLASMTAVFDTVPSPIGHLLITASEQGLTGIAFEQERHPRRPTDRLVPLHEADGPAADTLSEARLQLERYFAGELTGFTVPLAPSGTPFQRSVWAALGDIPFGDVISYGELARRLGAPAAVRAVGGANGRNPIPIVVPCHRVIGADGSLTGFGGGIERKRWLLRHEGVLGGVPAGLWRAGGDGSIVADRNRPPHNQRQR